MKRLGLYPAFFCYNTFKVKNKIIILYNKYDTI